MAKGLWKWLGNDAAISFLDNGIFNHLKWNHPKPKEKLSQSAYGSVLFQIIFNIFLRLGFQASCFWWILSICYRFCYRFSWWIIVTIYNNNKFAYKHFTAVMQIIWISKRCDLRTLRLCTNLNLKITKELSRKTQVVFYLSGS